REGAHRRCDRAEVLGRQPAQGRRQGRLSTAALRLLRGSRGRLRGGLLHFRSPPYPGGVTSFATRLASAVEEKGAPLCVGIDPDPALMPAGVGLVEFCRGIVDAVAPVTAVVKPQTAFYEQYGAEGWAALRGLCDYAREAGP